METLCFHLYVTSSHAYVFTLASLGSLTTHSRGELGLLSFTAPPGLPQGPLLVHSVDAGCPLCQHRKAAE